MNGALVGGWVTYSTAARLYQGPRLHLGQQRGRERDCVCVSVCVCACICFVYWTDKWVVEHMLSSVLQQRKKSLLCCNGSRWIPFSQSESVVPCQPGYKKKLAIKLNVSCRFPTSIINWSYSSRINKWKLMS
jgi:hypothetical protein